MINSAIFLKLDRHECYIIVMVIVIVIMITMREFESVCEFIHLKFQKVDISESRIWKARHSRASDTIGAQRVATTAAGLSEIDRPTLSGGPLLASARARGRGPGQRTPALSALASAFHSFCAETHEQRTRTRVARPDKQNNTNNTNNNN